MTKFDLLKQVLPSNIVDGAKERYDLNYPGKKVALVKKKVSILTQHKTSK